MSTCPSSLSCIHALPKSPWGKPPVFPARGQHPRVLFTRCRLSEIQENLTHPENQFAYQRMLALAQQTTDGMLAPPAPGQHNMVHELLAIIEAKAFLYALIKDASLAYNKQTISSNSLLIINPRMKDCGHWVYSGGQTIQGSISEEHKTLSSWQASAAFRQAKVLSHAISDEYCSLCGDITRAYDSQTAEKVVRHMLSVFTRDEAHPLIFAVYDDIISADAAFRKVFLLHTQQQPRLTADGFAIMDSTQRGNHGRLVAQSCVYETEKTLIPGCQVNGKEPPLKRTYPQNSVCEIGWGRIEISPKHPTRQNRLFTLMYVADANSSQAPIRAMPIGNKNPCGCCTDGLCAHFLPGRSALTAGNKLRLSRSGENPCSAVRYRRW